MKQCSPTQGGWQVTSHYPPSPQFEAVLRGKLCPYCLNPTDRSSSCGDRIQCLPCEASVSIDRYGLPKGSLAKADLKQARVRAHQVFDPLWSLTAVSDIAPLGEGRNLCYRWLSTKLEVPVGYCHIGMFNLEQCQQVVRICRPYNDAIGNANGKAVLRQLSQELKQQSLAQFLAVMGLDYSLTLTDRDVLQKIPVWIKRSFQSQWSNRIGRPPSNRQIVSCCHCLSVAQNIKQAVELAIEQQTT
jgi:hypothetical protein